MSRIRSVRGEFYIDFEEIGTAQILVFVGYALEVLRPLSSVRVVGGLFWYRAITDPEQTIDGAGRADGGDGAVPANELSTSFFAGLRHRRAICL